MMLLMIYLFILQCYTLGFMVSCVDFFSRIWHKFQWGRSGKEFCSVLKVFGYLIRQPFSGFNTPNPVLFISLQALFSPRPQHLGCWEWASPIPTEMPMVALRVLTGWFKAEGYPLFITSPFFQHTPSEERDERDEKREWIVKKSGWVTHLHEVHTRVTRAFIE